MRKIHTVTTTLILLFSLHGTFCFAQSAQNESGTYIWFDKVVGAMNLQLANGIEYIEKERTINSKTKFLFSADFLPGAVVYDGQTYFNVPMKFNVYNDLVIVKLRENLKMSIFQLLNEKLDAFILKGHHFIQIEGTEDNSGINGFFEVLFERPNFKLLKKYRKNRQKRLEKDFVYFEFYQADSEYIILSNNKYYEYNSKRDVFDVFPENKQKIRRFYRTYKSILKSNPELFMVNLFEELIPTGGRNTYGE